MKEKPVIKDSGELVDYFFQVKDAWDGLSRGINISTTVRNQFILGDHQGKIMMKGRMVRVLYEPLVSGCWRAYIPDSEFNLEASTRE